MLLNLAFIFKVSAAFCILVATLLSPHIYTNAQSATTVRPYKFGFTIDEQQHRYEKRDERGIVMGEFGFITADGIYHVTVYATDEEGKFRILAFKNYPYESPPKTIDMIVKSKPKVSSPTSTTTNAPKVATSTRHPSFNFGREACSGCFLTNKALTSNAKGSTTTSTKNQIRPLSRTFDDVGAAPSPLPGISTIKGIDRQASAAIADSLEIARHATHTITHNTNTQRHNQNFNTRQQFGAATAVYGTQNALQTAASSNQNRQQKYTNIFNKQNTNKSATPNTRNINPASVSNFNNAAPKATNPNSSGVYTQNSGGSAAKAPVLPSLGNTGKAPQTSKTPSIAKAVNTNAAVAPRTSFAAAANAGKARSAVTSSSSASDAGDLYRFKYILDYNGHTETGSRNGNKQGNFYAIGDDNVERTIEYVANEFGFQPRIRWRKLSANEVKSKENTLKDYEFVWFKQQ